MLEERHEFNKTTPGLFISDLLKTRICHRWTVPLCILLRVQMCWRLLCSVAHVIPVRCPCCRYPGEVLIKRIKTPGIPCVHGDSLPDLGPATAQQAFAAAFRRVVFSG